MNILNPAEKAMYVEFVRHLNNYPGDNILDKYEEYKNQIIHTYHKPLREQGNYINESIVEFQKLSKDIKRKKLSESNGRIYNTLRKTLQLDETTIQNSKLVIFTCMRMGHDDETLQRSLQFAHCINPFKLEVEPYFTCSRDLNRFNFQTGSGSPQIALSRRTVQSLQRLGMFNLVKAIRYKYYQKQSKLQHDIILLTDRIATLLLAIVLLTLTEDAVALGVMFDQIVCSSLLKYKNDQKMLLLPVYLPFI